MKRILPFIAIATLLSTLLLSCVSTEKEMEQVQEVETVEMTKTGPFSHQDAEALQGPFEKPQQVTSACISCHQEEVTDFMKTVHWTWEGNAPGLQW